MMLVKHLPHHVNLALRNNPAAQGHLKVLGHFRAHGIVDAPACPIELENYLGNVQVGRLQHDLYIVVHFVNFEDGFATLPSLGDAQALTFKNCRPLLLFFIASQELPVPELEFVLVELALPRLLQIEPSPSPSWSAARVGFGNGKITACNLSIPDLKALLIASLRPEMKGLWSLMIYESQK
ncbi:hypothetical protein B0T21DRAFT_388453 [Apiosordaria backusii]|uniref:Uncharacterized protein n=1 Tax=Apiosordaria backusii TaxID=314023 RepID=A0AA40K6P0_9PEZI|nr:hypothetical protein B0T21DRAFT_388453 [Apiosordaria backusii]